VDIQHSRHSGRYKVADTQRRIHSGRYTAADTQQHQIKIHSRSLGDLPDIVTSPPCSTFRILGAAKPPPMLVIVIHMVVRSKHSHWLTGSTYLLAVADCGRLWQMPKIKLSLNSNPKSPVHNFVSDYIVFYARNVHNYFLLFLKDSDLRYPQY